jgi:glycosyltransferase involved in cell wall biosynthesis
MMLSNIPTLHEQVGELRALLLRCCTSVKLRRLGTNLSLQTRRQLRGFAQRIALAKLAEPIFVEFQATEDASTTTDESCPLVSIIVPVFNGAAYLKECLESALSQGPESLIEVIAIDDCSTDIAVAPILASVKRNNPRLQLFKNNTNLGISQTQNLLIKKAKGTFIAFLDCDDFLRPDALETLRPVLKEFGVNYIHTATVLLDQPSGSTVIERSNLLPKRSYFHENRHMFFAKHLKVIRKSAIERIGGFQDRYDAAQDLDIALRLAFYYPSSSFRYVDEPLYVHRIHTKARYCNDENLQRGRYSLFHKHEQARNVV